MTMVLQTISSTSNLDVCAWRGCGRPTLALTCEQKRREAPLLRVGIERVVRDRELDNHLHDSHPPFAFQFFLL